MHTCWTLQWFLPSETLFEICFQKQIWKSWIVLACSQTADYKLCHLTDFCQCLQWFGHIPAVWPCDAAGANGSTAVDYIIRCFFTWNRFQLFLFVIWGSHWNLLFTIIYFFQMPFVYNLLLYRCSRFSVLNCKNPS